MFFCEICEIFKNIHFEEHLRTTVRTLELYQTSMVEHFAKILRAKTVSGCHRCVIGSLIRLWDPSLFSKSHLMIEIFWLIYKFWKFVFKFGRFFLQISLENKGKVAGKCLWWSKFYYTCKVTTVIFAI